MSIANLLKDPNNEAHVVQASYLNLPYAQYLADFNNGFSESVDINTSSGLIFIDNIPNLPVNQTPAQIPTLTVNFDQITAFSPVIITLVADSDQGARKISVNLDVINVQVFQINFVNLTQSVISGSPLNCAISYIITNPQSVL